MMQSGSLDKQLKIHEFSYLVFREFNQLHSLAYIKKGHTPVKVLPVLNGP